MKKALIIICLSIFSLNAAIIDSDLDGVADTQDMCPNTPFLQTVDKNGCSKQQLQKISKWKFNASLGYEHDKYGSEENDLYLFNIIAYTKQASISYLASMLNSKSNDSILSIYYKKFVAKYTSVKIGFKTYFPTHYNSKIDFALKIKATYYSNWAYSISEKHKIYTETDANDKDTITLSMGKLIGKFYISPYIYTENSAYDSHNWNQYLGFFTQHYINNKTYISLDLSANIDDLCTTYSTLDKHDIENYSIIVNIGHYF